jgi:tetratricopeptide (TPR) repeat protein
VLEDLAALRTLDLVSLDRAEEQAWLFKHVVTQEVAYESLPFALRADLHGRVGAFLEQREAHDLDRWVPLLEHHYWRSNREEKKRLYLRLAAEAAQASYANQAAIAYYDRLIPLLDGAEQVDDRLKVAKILERTGAWTRSEEILGEARSTAVALEDTGRIAWCDTSLAEAARKQGRYDDAEARLAAARTGFLAAASDDGLGQVLHLSGTLAAQQGNYEAAAKRYHESLLIRERLGDRSGTAALLSNLGVVAEYSGDYAGAQEFNERALAVRTELGDRWAIGVSQNNLGMIALHERRFEEARARFMESMRLNREVGDAWMVAIGHNNLGNANRGLGDIVAAKASYAASLEAYREYDDKWAMAFLIEDIALLAAQTGDAQRAVELTSAAESLREAIGAPRSPALVEELDAGLAGARASLGEAASVAAERGRAMDAAAAVRLALRICTD